MTGVDFSGYGFEGIDLNDMDVTNCLIDLEVLKSRGLYDDSFYKKIVGDTSYFLDIPYKQPGELVEFRETDFFESSFENFIISYISDIHLDDKIYEEFPSGASEIQIRTYLRRLVDEIHDSSRKNNTSYLLIAGDTSYNPFLFRIFNEILCQSFPPKQIINVLGNHELWGFTSYDDSVKHYCSVFSELKPALLENSLLVIKGQSRLMVEENDLLEATNEEILELCSDANMIVLGGIGFSGRNDDFNFDSGMYREAIKSRDEEIELSKRFERLHEKLLGVLSDRNLIVLTHMPFSCWNGGEVCKNWFYVSGHTHRNYREYCDDLKLFSDNQVGYARKKLHLNSFQLSYLYDYFKNLPDGHRIISNEDYLKFYGGLCMQTSCGNVSTIHMLKNNGYYLFINESKKGVLSVLKGGSLKKIDTQDLGECYQKMARYVQILQKSLENYMDSLERISVFVKSIGGTGRIHGCIVDINFLNHVFLNPKDGTVTLYYANSIVDKVVYSDMEALLSDNCPELLGNYMKLIDSGNCSVPVVSENVEKTQHYTGTEMYKISNMMLNYQYALKKHVIRVWNESVFNISPDTDPITLIETVVEDGGNRQCLRTMHVPD